MMSEDAAYITTYIYPIWDLLLMGSKLFKDYYPCTAKGHLTVFEQSENGLFVN